MKKNYKGMAALAMLSAGLFSIEQATAQGTAYHPTIGNFVSVKPTAQTQTIVMPPTHTFQLLAKSGTTAYTNASGTLPINNDFTGFIGVNGSSKLGYLSINHENNPGGVSLLDINLSESTMLWQTTAVRKVDFTPVVAVERNCSGGVTPWGTVISSEENFTTGDVNGDGYQDRGWQVEIDPVSGTVRDLDGDGKPDKLWALGRMAHENIAVGNDSVTVYQAEDGGTSCVYKFIASKKTDLSDGTLYVLKRDNATATTGTWIQVPNITQSDRNNTRTIAGNLGGTNWNGPEDIEFGPDGKTYFTSKGTGTIWRFKDDGTTVSEIEAWVTNKSYAITHPDGVQNESWGTGIDNLAFDGDGNLWALQDGGRNHLWVVRPDHTPANPKVELFATIPAGAEPTGLTFSPDYRYGFVSIQHPNSSNTLIVKDAAGNDVRFNNASTLVFSRKEYLGTLAVEPVFELGADQLICKGDTLELTAYNEPDAIVKWSGEALPDSIEGASLPITQAGMYYATAYKNNGRRYTDSVNITVEALQAPYLGYKLPLCNTCSIMLNAGPGFHSYLWNDNSTAETMMAYQPGVYSVTCASENNCSVTSNVEVIQYNGNGNTLVPSQMIEVFPNPFQTNATIKLSVREEANVVLEVFSNGGNKVAALHNGTLGIGDHFFNFQPTTPNNNGVYIVKLKVNNQQHSMMIKKQ